MSKSLPPNDFGISILADSVSKISVNDVIQQYYQQWQQQLARMTIDIMDTPVQLTSSQMSHGATRAWFTCPQCQRRCGVLFKEPVSEEIGCRICLGVKYRKSRYKGMVEADIVF